jgi:hypothetical protein
VLIITADPDALRVVHEFLRFQITDHREGRVVESKQTKSLTAWPKRPLAVQKTVSVATAHPVNPGCYIPA